MRLVTSPGAAPLLSRHQLQASRARLARELEGHRWLSEPAASVEDFELEDFTCLPGEPGPLVLTVLRFQASGRRYFVPLRATSTGGGNWELREASYDPGLLTSLVQCMRDQVTLVTERQRSIQFLARHLSLAGVHPPAGMQATWAVPFQEGMSSNCLSELRHGNGRSVFKLYKYLSPHSGNELRAQELLAGTGLTPELLGSLTYHEGDSLHALGSITSMAEGEPIHLLFSRHIRALCGRVIRAPDEVLELTRSALAELAPLCLAAGEHLLRFHQRLNQGSTCSSRPPPAFQLSHYLEAHHGRWERLHAAVEQDASVPPALRARVLHQLRRMARSILAPERLRHLPPLGASIPHGDLHLSHILVAPEAGGPPRLHLLDVSPRSLDETASAFSTQTLLQDLLSLWRAIQYFAFDELLDGIKDVLGITQLEATRRVLEQPERLPTACTALLRLLSHWSRELFGAIHHAYLDASRREALLEPPAAWSQLFYACRLLHELEYNYDCNRDFFKYCDFYYLLQLEMTD
jgi:hypothetical protein